VKQAAAGLLQSLRPGDSAAIVDCDSSATLIAPLSDDVDAVRAGLDTVTAGGTTALHDAILRASTELEAVVRARGPRRQRPVIVVFSDGADTASSAVVGDVLERAEQDGTAVYPIALRAAGPRPQKGIAAVLQNQGASVLRRLADATGGRMFVPSSIPELRVVFTQLEEELTSQYLLGFTPPRTGGAERRRIDVAVRRAGATVRARAAYVME
jgi:VWFA-related protein